MDTAWKLASGAPALIFTLLGLAWWARPDLAGAQLGMTLLSDVGLSSQIGDLASFFLTLGSCILIGLATGHRVWLCPAIMLVAFAISGRFIAWLFHDAALPVAIIAVEASVVAVLVITSRVLAREQTYRRIHSQAVHPMWTRLVKEVQ